MKKKNVWIPILMFLLCIFGGMIWSKASPDRAYSDTENRYLEQKPAFSLKTLFNGEYTSDYETYITDQFPLRDQWIGLKTAVEKTLGKQETKDVWLAEDDYLIVNHPASDFQGEQAEKNAQVLASALDYYVQELGADHVRTLLVPTASQILTDKLPVNAIRYDQSQYIRRVQETVQGQLAANWTQELFIDAEAVLSAHAGEYIYYRTDHHWTTQGAFYAYQVWAESLGLVPLTDSHLKAVSETFEGTTYSKLHYAGQRDTLSVYDTEETVTLIHNQMTETEGFYDWSALDTRDQYAVFLGGNDGLLEIRKEGEEAVQEGPAVQRDLSTEKVLLVVKDSFANCFVPYAAEHFDRVIVVDLRSLNMSLKMVAEQYGVTDLLVLYNVQAFATDNTVFKINR